MRTADKTIYIVAGPTATGKTALGVRLAESFGGEVVSADSMQVYRHMDIGTAKPEPSELRGVRHHMLSVAEPGESWSAALYVEQAGRCVEDIQARGKRVFLVGGTGLYIESLVRGREFSDYIPQSGQRQRLEALAAEKGNGELVRLLQECDPESAQRLHENDTRRLIRALEVFCETGKTISQHDRESRAAPPKYDSRLLVLSFKERQALYDRIDLRVDEMLRRGLEGEIDRLLEMGVSPESTAMQAIGYKELLSWRRGERTYCEAVEDVKRESRRYAKRQLTWFRHRPGAHFLLQDAPPDLNATFSEATKFFGLT